MKKPVIHKARTASSCPQWWAQHPTACGLDFRKENVRQDWAGVNCKNCLRTRKAKPRRARNLKG